MPTPTSRRDAPTTLKPVPIPTHPVARRSVSSDTPTFEWTPVPNADAYRLQLAATDAFETVYHEDTLEAPASVPLADVLPADATTVAWRVRAETGPEASWSSPAHFDVSEGTTSNERQFLVNAPPAPAHPLEGDAVESRAAAFAWEEVPEASGYHLQVGTAETFDDPVVSLTFDETTSIALFGLLPEERAPLFWRVRALFPNDTAGPWCRAIRFGTGAEEDEEPIEDIPSPDPASSVESSPVAAGPAREARTSPAMAITFVFVLVVSFLATILLTMWLL